MVVHKEERKNAKEYSLNRIRELAAAGKVEYGSSTVFKDTENLSYSPSDVCQCLEKLTDQHYRGSVHYGDKKRLA